MAALAVLGSGGHGQDIADIAAACGLSVKFYDDATGPPTCRATEPYIAAVNDPTVRKAIALRMGATAAAPLVHPTAVVSSTAILGHGVVVGANTTIGPNTVLNDHVHVGAACTITRTLVGAFTTIGPGCDIAGDCVIKPEVFLGVGVVVRNLITIHARARIGAGSVVIDHVPDDTTVVGVPARPLQRRETAA